MNYPNQLEIGRNFAKKVKPKTPKKIDNLIVCGMGGSALPGDLLREYLEFQPTKKTAFPVIVEKGYHLPAVAGKKSLIFISSYSGNTEETVSCLKEAINKKYSIVVFCAGGKIEEIAKKNHLPIVKYSINFPHFQPRYALTYAFAAMHQVLTNIGLSDRISGFPKIDPRSMEVYGEELSLLTKGRTPIIYATERYKFIAQNWKIKINENSKTPAFWNYFPELNHNEMVGFSLAQGKFTVFFLKDEKTEKVDEINNKRLDITKKLYEQKGIKTAIVPIKGKTFLEKILNTLVLGDWLSYYLALQYDQDPTPVEMVENFKKKLSHK